MIFINKIFERCTSCMRFGTVDLFVLHQSRKTELQLVFFDPSDSWLKTSLFWPSFLSPKRAERFRSSTGVPSTEKRAVRAHGNPLGEAR